jgi:hypothetical protein
MAAVSFVLRPCRHARGCLCVRSSYKLSNDGFSKLLKIRAEIVGNIARAI